MRKQPFRFRVTTNSRPIVHDLKRTQQLCNMIAVGRERLWLQMKMDGVELPYQASGACVDPRMGSRYSFILTSYIAPAFHSPGSRRVFAIEHETAAIFEVTVSGRVNRERRYGTLDTLEDWNWAFSRPRLRVTSLY